MRLGVEDSVSSLLSFGEAIFFAEQSAYIHVLVEQSMGSIPDALFGVIGPFKRDSYVAVPLSLAKFLAEEKIAVPQLPIWLTESKLEELTKEEKQNEELCQCPHPHYIEIAYLFFNCSRNPWSSKSYGERNNVLRLFEDFVAMRLKKILKLNTYLIKHGAMITTALSDFERRRLGTIGLYYIKKLTVKSSQSNTDCLEDILASTNILNAEEHFSLLEQAQEAYERVTLTEND